MKVVYRKDQKDIMSYKSGTMGVQAVPGAGKTFIITQLVSVLLEDMVKNNIDGKVLVLTYMNSAVNNFKSRINKIVDEKNIPHSRFEVMTIHSLAMSIIKENSDLASVNSEFEVIDDYKKGIILEQSIERYLENCSKNPIMSFVDWNKVDKRKGNREEISKKWFNEFMDIVSSAIRGLKYENIDSSTLKIMVQERQEKFKKENDIIKRDDYRGIMSIISPIYSIFQEEMRSSGYLDYDDILLIAFNILNENPEIALYYQNKYRYVFEDECQDSNLIQEKIIDIISGNKNNRKKSDKNLVRVGDVNQSITGTFTGSDPSNFIKFCKMADYSFNMNMASRSSKDIIDLANELVRMVCDDKKSAYYNSLEELFIEEVEKGKGYKGNPQTLEYGILSKEARSDEENTNNIVDEIKKIQKKHPEYSIGILNFANYVTDDLAEELEQRNIKFEKLGGNLSERKKLISDLKLAVDFLINPEDRETFVDFIIEAFVVRRSTKVEKTEEVNTEDISLIKKYFQRVDIEKWIYDDEYFSKFKNEDGGSEVVERFLSDIDILKQKYDFFGIREKIKSICNFSQVNPAKLVEHISYNLDLDSLERKFVIYVIFYIENLINFENADLERVSISLDRKYSRVFDSVIDSIYEVGEKEPEPGSITLATLHKSKGMEWDAVIISGLNNNNFPSSYADYFRVDIKYLKDSYKYPQADVNRDLDYFTGKPLKKRYEYEMELKKEIIAERVRLLYVGLTRAKKSLLLLYSRIETNKNNGMTFNKKKSLYFNRLTDYIRSRV